MIWGTEGGVPGVVRLGDVDGVDCKASLEFECSKSGDSGSVWISEFSTSESYAS